MKDRTAFFCVLILAAAVVLLASVTAPSEVILQYFNTSWKELAHKVPELAEAGYGSLWLPPPTKGSGALSVGYDHWDPFDLGGKDQRGTVRTRYGTEAELLHLIEVAHRFGLRVYFDNIMNHRAFDVPGYNADTAIDIYPGLVPEDFHLRVTEEGFYRKWDNVANWGDTWQIQNRNFSDLIDIAQEPSDYNNNFGYSEGSTLKKISLLRQPDNPGYYYELADSTYVGFDSTNITADYLAEHEEYYKENVQDYLNRAVRWLVDRTKVDGLRLDAVKHVEEDFFGATYGEDKDTSDYGYLGQAQRQFNITRGFSDANHRDTVFETETVQGHGRDDLMMFGEHLGEPPSFGVYIDAGMRLVDSQLHGHLNGILGETWGSLDGLDWAGAYGFSPWTGVMYAKSHDDDYATRPELQYAYYLTREGLPNIYTDGNYQSETLAQSGGAFPRHANTAFLGQWGDNRIPNLVYIHNHFAHGPLVYDDGTPIEGQIPKYADADVCAYERRDKRENTGMDHADGTVLFFVMNDDYSAGAYREIETTFPQDAYLWQYSTGGGNFYYTVPSDQKIKVTVPPGGYFCFSWRSPEASDMWSCFSGKPVVIEQDAEQVGWISCVRRDGPDGDPGFNPYGVSDADPNDYAYTYYVPRVTSGTNLRFVVRADGSAENVMIKLDGGVNLNDTSHPGGDTRDHPPALSTDIYLGYEQSRFVHRQYEEKFASVDSARNKLGSAGAETYIATIGTSGFTTNLSDASNDGDPTYTAKWIYHDPNTIDEWGNAQFDPLPGSATTQVTFRVKVGYSGLINNLYLYYILGTGEWPEGAGGEGWENTGTLKLNWYADGTHDGTGTPTWWSGTLQGLTNGTALRYKVGGFKVQNGDTNQYPYVPWWVVFPSNGDNVYRKKKMMGVWEVTNFNAQTVTYRPHNDYGLTYTGLVEGFHVLRGRAFLERTNRAAIYNTFVQTFYYDLAAPTGEVIYPAESESLGSKEYGVVVRADWTADSAWYNIVDSDPANDDGQTGQNNGNGTNAAGATAWASAYEVTPSLSLDSDYPREWRFNYRNIPSGGSAATIYVKLGEVSSSTNPALSASEGHFGLLTRNVTASAPAYDLYVAWPQNDGDYVSENYDLKVYFSKTLADGIDTNTLRERFLIKINDSAQGRENYWFEGVDGSHDALAYTLPDLYNGDSNFLHNIYVIHTNAGGGGVTLQASRYVKASPSAAGVHVDIVSPPEYDSDGKPFEIVLPDVASPSSTQRQYTIRVATDTSVKDVWIVFTNSVGYTLPLYRTTNVLAGTVSVTAGTNTVIGHEIALTGTVSATYSNTTVTGSGTAFNDALSVGSSLRIDTNYMVVTQIASQTSLEINIPYPGSTTSNAAAAAAPSFDTQLGVGNNVLIDTSVVVVAQVPSRSNLTLTADYPGPTAPGVTAYRLSGNPTAEGSMLYWSFLWTNMTEGYFRFHANADTNYDTGTIEASAVRNTRVIFREVVAVDTNDLDDDDDGLYDDPEATPTNLPAGNSEDWNNGNVHIYYAYGRTDPLRPDSDGDGLPDGLELGWRSPGGDTSTNEDTNGDGWMNFASDYDPPFYNTLDNHTDGGNACTVPGVNSRNEGGDRARLAAGSVTDPNNADSDYDGLPDGVEDANHNGWVDGDGSALGPSEDECSRGSWPDGQWDSAWTETDPNDSDTDGDNAADGYGEDTNFNGRVDGDTNSNRVYDAGEEWQETNPLDPDTDGDGMPDGWEKQYSLDPLDDGSNSLRTAAAADGNVTNGASGNPDGDVIVEGGVTNPYSNLLEYQNNTNPRVPDTGDEPPAGSITVGRGDPLGELTGSGTNYQEFTDWTIDDCLVLDEYEGDGYNNQGGDVYMAWDGFDSSRDIVAFYARDGGATDGNFYFRVDFQDLAANAEEGNLDFYVVVDFGTLDKGEMALPDDVDAGTSNRWEMVVAVYQSGQGAVLVDTDHDNNTTGIGQALDASVGVYRRTQSDANGFVDAYFNSELDACEFSVSRQALLDAGWAGLTATSFHYQVFTTKDGTQNDPVGAGDIGGRNDIRDTIYDDDAAEDWWLSQGTIKNMLGWWFNGGDRAGRGKIAVVLHGNQAILPGSDVQDLINTGDGAGYYRPLAVHELYGQPLNLHITPTLASAIEWAKVDTNASPAWRDGPDFNDWIGELYRTNVVYLLGSTFSDHILPYATYDFNGDNVDLAEEFLGAAYGFAPGSNTVFWAPERVLDKDALEKIEDLGYRYTLLDQMTHMFFWISRNTALGDGGYKINKFENVNCFVMNDGASGYRFSNTDDGLPVTLRSLLNRKARSGTQDQVVTLFSNWEDFTASSSADAYDLNIRWLANHPWTPLVAHEQIAAGEVDVTGDEAGDAWYVEDRSWATVTNKISHDWLYHATEEDYDHWYVGSALEEGLEHKYFEIRTGVSLPLQYGMLYTTGAVTQAWAQVKAIADTNLAKLARSALHASLFETAFHNQTNESGYARYSTGDYIYEDTTYMELAKFAKAAQAQSRMAAVYERVDDWAGWVTNGTGPATSAEDIDLDGEDEYLLYNDRLFAVFERIGGRMVAAFVRDLVGGAVYQAAGNLASYADEETEEEGEYNVDTNRVVAHRTSCLKDWWATTVGGTNATLQYINELYTVSDRTNGWRFTTSDSRIQKTITLHACAWAFEVEYQLPGPDHVLYVRHGLSPDLYDLLLNGQECVGSEEHASGVMVLRNTNYGATVASRIGYLDAGHNTGFNEEARDDDWGKGVTNYTLRMRNQAQTHQVELVGTNAFLFSLGFEAAASDWDGDGMPNTYEDGQGFDATDGADGTEDADTDQVINWHEYVANTDPHNGTEYLGLTASQYTPTGIVVRFPTKTQRDYFVWYKNASIMDPSWTLATSNGIPGTGATYDWLDDGSQTDPAPNSEAVTSRFYRIEVDLPR